VTVRAALPPLAAVRAFEAAARHESFTKAAAELGMTQAAVSYQIKLLEDRLGMPLFLRLPRKVQLSAAGRRLAPPVADAFRGLQAAFAAMRESAAGVLSITAVHTFATNWLVPRLGTFQLAHPDIAVRMDVSARTVDFAREEFDIGIRGGQGVWPGVAAHRLMDGEFAPFCSPAYLARVGPGLTPADLLRLPRLDADDPWWRQWFELAGVSDPGTAQTAGFSFNVQSMVGTAAMSGQGFAILTPAFFAADIAAGRLVQPFDLVAKDGQGYWLVYPEERRNAPKIRAFRDWILEELRRDRNRSPVAPSR
jgi:LysR family transcriptional regulator, glycine cleavage system transcriptional activator